MRMDYAIDTMFLKIRHLKKKKFTTQNAGTEGRISASNGNVFLRYSKMTSVIKLQDQS